MVDIIDIESVGNYMIWYLTNLYFQLSERLLGNLHAASDLMSIDLTRGRDQGIQPYNEYRKVCGFPVAHKFEDFLDTIDEGVSLIIFLFKYWNRKQFFLKKKGNFENIFLRVGAE